ncbi:MAG: hypothetical protein WB763_06905, partial [Terriglobia bacterium]
MPAKKILPVPVSNVRLPSESKASGHQANHPKRAGSGLRLRRLLCGKALPFRWACALTNHPGPQLCRIPICNAYASPSRGHCSVQYDDPSGFYGGRFMELFSWESVKKEILNEKIARKVISG